MAITLESFKDPSRIPNSLKFLTMVLLFSATLVGGYVLDTNAQMSELEAMQAKEQELRTAWLDKKRQAINLDAHKKQLVDIEVAFGTLLRQLPNKAQMDALLNDVNQAGVGRGLNFELFQPSPTEILTEFYAEQPVRIVVSGTFGDIGSFAEDVSRLPRIVNLGDMNLRAVADQGAAGKAGPPRLTMDAIVRTYRYLDDKDRPKKK